MTSKFHYIQKFALLSAVLLCTSSGAVMAAEGAKEKEIYFYPSTKWKIEKKGDACSIQNQFNNGFIVKLSGGEQHVQGVSVNFRQKIFDSARTYNVTLSIPGVHESKFKASVPSKDTLFMNVRGDKDFYKKLRQNAVLDLSVGGNDFRFYMTGFTDEAQGFENCMAGKENIDNSKSMKNESIAMEQNTKALLPSPSSMASEALLDAEASEIMPEDGITPKTRQRLSDQLAKTIKRDPSLIDMDQNQKNPRLARKELEMPPKIDAVPDDAAVSALAPVESMDITSNSDDAPADKNTENTIPIPSAKPMAGGDDDMAETLDEIIRETAEPAAEFSAEPAAESSAEPSIESEKIEEKAVEKETIIFKDPPVKNTETLEDGMKPVKVSHQDTTRHSVPAYTMTKSVETRRADFTGAHSDQMQREVLKMESMIEQLKNENKALNEELSSSLNDSKVEHYTIESENWNLEQATERFNEAERQLLRMGQKLEGERARCNAEKSDLEAMLFDPNVTDEAQLARLSDLEKQLQDARDEVEIQRKRYEEQIKMLQAQNAQR